MLEEPQAPMELPSSGNDADAHLNLQLATVALSHEQLPSLNPSHNNLLKARSMADNGFPCVQNANPAPAWCLLMPALLLLNWMLCFPLQHWSFCGLFATLMVYPLLLHAGPSCSLPMVLGSTAAATMTWHRSWQDSTCLCLPMTMVSSLKLNLIYKPVL